MFGYAFSKFATTALNGASCDPDCAETRIVTVAMRAAAAVERPTVKASARAAVITPMSVLRDMLVTRDSFPRFGTLVSLSGQDRGVWRGVKISGGIALVDVHLAVDEFCGRR